MSMLVRSRRWLVVLAAYAVALQALLLPLAVAAGAAVPSSLCITAAPGDGQAPLTHDTGCACAAGCGMACASHAMLPPAPGSAARVSDFFRIATPSIGGKPIAQAAVRHPQNPRAPPVA